MKDDDICAEKEGGKYNMPKKKRKMKLQDWIDSISH